MPKQIQKRDALKGVTQTRKATMAKKQTKDDAITFVMVSDQNEGMRFDWWSGDEYIERLDINGANMESLNTFFKNHDREVDDAIGRVENKRKDGDFLLGDVIFDESGADIKRKYENRTLTDVSIGYKINKYEVEERENEPDIVTITDFDIMELSAVGIGFDSGAKKRESNNKEIHAMDEKLQERLLELESIAKRSKEQDKELNDLRATAEAERQKEITTLKAEKAELERKAEINAIATKYNASDAIREKFMKSGTVADLQAAILDERSKEQPNVPAHVGDTPNRDDMMRAMEDAIVMRSGSKVATPHGDANMFRGMSMVDMAKKVTGASGYDRNDIASRAMATTDFPMLLVSSGNRVLEANFDEQASTYQSWVSETDLPDFKTQTNVTLGSAGRLAKVAENGALTEETVAEAYEQWAIESYGKEFILSRQMIINDDLGAFTNLLAEFGRMAKRTANGIAYDLLQGTGDFATYTMQDGFPVFDATNHNNYTTTGTALSELSLTAARTMMMRQTDAKGNALNIMPKFLIVAPEQETLAKKLIASPSLDAANPAIQNPFVNSMVVVVDAELANGVWYIAGDRRTIKAGYLAGTGRRPIVQLDTTSLTQTVFQGVFDFGVVAEDYRGLYKNAGA